MVTVSPLKPEGVSDWFGKKLDWNPAFIPSSHRPAPPPRTLAPDPSLSLEEGLSEEPTARTVKVENGEYLLLVPPSRKLHIPSATLPESESSTHTLRRTLSEENVRHTGQKGVSDTSGTTSDGETQDQDDMDSTELSGTSELPSSNNVDDTLSPLTDNTEEDDDTETETVREVEDDDEREQTEQKGGSQKEEEKRDNTNPEDHGQSLATMPNETNKITNAREGIRRMLLLMELGRFASALEHADISINLLRKNLEEHKREIKFCALYKLVLSLLLKIKQLQRFTKEEGPSLSSSSSTGATKQQDQNVPALCLVSRHLAEVRVEPRHFQLLNSLVVDIQMDLRNFNYAARLIRRLLAQFEDELGVEERNKVRLQEKLRQCEEKGRGGGDVVTFPYKCVRCGHPHTGKVLLSSCDKCGTPVGYCHSSFQFLTRSQFYVCHLCQATYAQGTPKCLLCHSDTVQTNQHRPPI